MNHFLLPGQEDPTYASNSGRFGLNAMELILREFAKRNVANRFLRAKVFGGATGASLNGRKDIYQIAERNLIFVRDFLAAENIPIVSEDAGGTNVRTLRFFSDTFEVFVKKTAIATNYVVGREMEFKKAMDSTPVIQNKYVLF